jgi:hypothetical protein
VTRVTLTPVTLAGAGGLTLPSVGQQSLAGYTGVQFVNNGLLYLIVNNGAGSQTITQLIGGKVQGIAPTVAPVNLVANAVTKWGPWSAKDYTQLDGSGMQYIDFGGTQANISVTLYQLVPAQ